jgi:phospholipid/cholesterol/gamma-HCH transport system ATP-binding protein
LNFVVASRNVNRAGRERRGENRLDIVGFLIRQLNDAMGLTSIVVSHDLNETFHIADQVIILANGKIAAQGTPDEVRKSEDPLVHQFVNALPEGPVRFHYPAVDIAQDFSAGAQP